MGTAVGTRVLMQGRVMLFCCQPVFFFSKVILNTTCMEGIKKWNKMTQITAFRIKSMQDLN